MRRATVKADIPFRSFERGVHERGEQYCVDDVVKNSTQKGPHRNFESPFLAFDLLTALLNSTKTLPLSVRGHENL